MSYKWLEKITFCLTAILISAIALFLIQFSAFAEVLTNEAETYRIQGYEAQQKGQYQKALQLYSKALSLGLESAALYNDIGVLYEYLTVNDRAEQYYLEAIKRDPQYLPPYTNLAFLYKDRGDRDRAIQYFRERYRLASPEDPWRVKAKQELINLDPSIKQRLIQEEADILNEEMVVQAHTEFTLRVTRAEKHFQAGQQFQSEKKYERAAEQYHLALKMAPNNPKFLNALEEVNHQQLLDDIRQRTAQAIDKLNSGDLDSAKEDFQDILATFPEPSVQ